jgi:cyclopropane fatty-acyl-phospholipid synthase-like methyltransferase
MRKEIASKRLRWAVAILDVKPDEQLLEIGCGHGVAVSLVCERLRGGSILALDRSATMIAQATRRNAAAVEAGMATFQTAALHEADLGGRRFDTIFAIHVGVFLRGDPSRELAIIREHLAPGGRFFLPYQPLDPTIVEADGTRYATVLERNNFTVSHRHFAALDSGRAGCVVATPRP